MSSLISKNKSAKKKIFFAIFYIHLYSKKEEKNAFAIIEFE